MLHGQIRHSHRRKFIKKRNHVSSTSSFPLSNEAKSIIHRSCVQILFYRCNNFQEKKRGRKCFNGRKFHFYRGEYHLTLSTGVRIEWKVLEVWENASSCCSCTFASMHNNVSPPFERTCAFLLRKDGTMMTRKFTVCEKIPG